ncbi:uncharacterized protein N7511_009894 [Penicillium nucicola]|uniref:uncharacterized protein n=1 Tax=Penicillium nucicola TaxID=1850975 RepID=UPI0025455EF9|nr:uncharacterized protein N7511_009894 [Penicillium nucicola]KAJ5748198.1 hypothetical protein N7511_009894 [Penicillium nucicola]
MMDADITPIPRSREENQERAFIAASRRKDRSLDARLESANRASMLHKKRTGKGFHITKEIVEREAMYEEVDERYAEKRIRMLQAQNMQIEQQFHRHLIAAFGRPNGASIANRRASTYTPRPSTEGPRKMSLDLTNIRSSFSQNSNSMASPMPTSDGYILSPTASFDNSANSYMACMPGSEAPYSMVSSDPNSAHIPDYVNQQATTPAWSTQMPNWAMQQQVPTPSQTPTDQVQMWQQSMMQQPTASDIQMQRQFRDRLASAPELPLHQAPRIAPSASISGPTPSAGAHGHAHPMGHSRGQSQPSNNFHNLHLLTQSTHLAMPASSASSPRIEALSAETHSTPDFCPTPHSPMSPTAVATQMSMPSMPAPAKMDGTGHGDGIMVSNEGMDADYSDFSQFALHLENSTVPLSDREPFGFDDFVTVDEFTSVSC